MPVTHAKVTVPSCENPFQDDPDLVLIKQRNARLQVILLN